MAACFVDDLFSALFMCRNKDLYLLSGQGMNAGF